MENLRLRQVWIERPSRRLGNRRPIWTRNSLVSATGVSKVRNFGRAFDVWAMGCIIIELAIVLVYGWENGKLQTFTRKRTENGTPNDPFHKNMPVVTRWTENLERDDGSYSIIGLMRTARDMIHIEPEARLYSWEAYLNVYERLNPNETADARREMMDKFIQGPKDSQVSSKENPRARKVMEKNPIREDCLAKRDGHRSSPHQKLEISSKISIACRSQLTLESFSLSFMMVMVTLKSDKTLLDNLRKLFLQRTSFLLKRSSSFNKAEIGIPQKPWNIE